MAIIIDYAYQMVARCSPQVRQAIGEHADIFGLMLGERFGRSNYSKT
jgi:hypothetical protein